MSSATHPDFDEQAEDQDSQPARHLSEIVASALSPNGSYLATGSNFSGSYDDGHLLIWDVAAARLLRVHTIVGGVSWPDHPQLVTWRPDGQRIGIAFDTNAVGVLDPFTGDADFAMTARVTNGWPSPPDFVFSPDGRQIYVACWGPDHAFGAFLCTEEPSPTPRWAFRVPFTLDEDGDEDEPALEPLSRLRWQVPGLLTGWSDLRTLVGIDPVNGTHLWTQEVFRPTRWRADGTPDRTKDWQRDLVTQLIESPDGRWVAGVVPNEQAQYRAPGIYLYSQNEQQTALPVRISEAALKMPRFAWSPDGARYALLRDDGVLEIRTLEAVPGRVAEVAVEGATAVYYGDNIAAVGPELVAFLRPDGTLLERYPQGAVD